MNGKILLSFFFDYSKVIRIIFHFFSMSFSFSFSFSFSCLFSAATVNPGTWEITNKWNYRDEFVDIQPSPKNGEEFTIHLRKNASTKKTSSTTFSSPYRSELLTHAQKFRDFFCIDSSKGIAELYLTKKIKSNGTVTEVYLSPNYSCLDQLHQFTKKAVGSYDFKDITSIDIISDVPGGFAVNYILFNFSFFVFSFFFFFFSFSFPVCWPSALTLNLLFLTWEIWTPASVCL